MIKQFFTKYLDKKWNAGYYQRILDERERHDFTKEIMLQDAIGKKVIYCSNEWVDPDFVIIDGYETFGSQKLMIGKEVITNRRVVLHLGSVYLADEKMVKAILKLDPFERWNMSAGKTLLNNMWEKTYPPREELTPPDVLETKLREKGFI